MPLMAEQTNHLKCVRRVSLQSGRTERMKWAWHFNFPSFYSSCTFWRNVPNGSAYNPSLCDILVNSHL